MNLNTKERWGLLLCLHKGQPTKRPQIIISVRFQWFCCSFGVYTQICVHDVGVHTQAHASHCGMYIDVWGQCVGITSLFLVGPTDWNQVNSLDSKCLYLLRYLASLPQIPLTLEHVCEVCMPGRGLNIVFYF